MKNFNYVITDEVGIHARPAGAIAKLVKQYSSKVTVHANGKSVNAAAVMMMMASGIKCGTEITVDVEGADEENAAAELEQFFKDNL